jgi:uncharacterized protein (DUF427 family)
MTPDYPPMIASVNLVEPAPRRVRATLAGRTVFDTVRARYVWECANYPQYYIPIADIVGDFLVDELHEQRRPQGTARQHGLKVGDVDKPRAARVFGADALAGLEGHVRFEWDAFDAWYEEDERIYVHPRNPYVRVDALRSTRRVRVELDGVVLAESDSPVMVFETGLPTRYYLNRTDVDFSHLVPTETVTECPYKGTASQYWSIRLSDGTLHPDLAWSYEFPTRQLLPITGMIAFYNEKVDHVLDGVPQERPVTHFFRS